MTRKSCLMVLVAATALPLFAACSDVASTSTEPTAQIRRDGGDSTSLVGCGDFMPWGIAPCIVK